MFRRQTHEIRNRIISELLVVTKTTFIRLNWIVNFLSVLKLKPGGLMFCSFF